MAAAGASQTLKTLGRHDRTGTVVHGEKLRENPKKESGPGRLSAQPAEKEMDCDEGLDAYIRYICRRCGKTRREHTARDPLLVVEENKPAWDQKNGPKCLACRTLVAGAFYKYPDRACPQRRHVQRRSAPPVPTTQRIAQYPPMVHRSTMIRARYVTAHHSLIGADFKRALKGN